jgi:hypothetical protein
MNAETPYAETEALLAVMNGDEEEALRLVDELLPGERAALVKHLRKLAHIADDTQRCVECKRPVDPWKSVFIFRGGTNWHAECLATNRKRATR